MRVCVRACAYICMYDYYIILLYMQAQCVRTFVGTRVRTCMYVRACERIYAYVSACACVRVHICEFVSVCSVCT